MAEICFGRTCNTIENQENRFLIDVISDRAQALNIVGVITHTKRCLALTVPAY